MKFSQPVAGLWESYSRYTSAPNRHSHLVSHHHLCQRERGCQHLTYMQTLCYMNMQSVNKPVYVHLLTRVSSSRPKGLLVPAELLRSEHVGNARRAKLILLFASKHFRGSSVAEDPADTATHAGYPDHETIHDISSSPERDNLVGCGGP